jgi:hypothetical protein
MVSPGPRKDTRAMSQPKVSTEHPSPEASAWELEFARLIALPAQPALSITQNWWKDLVHDLPDDYVLIQKKGSHEERGTFQDVRLSLTIDQHQVEWLIQPLGEFDESADTLPTIGPFRDKIRWFVNLMVPWLANSSPPLLRLAFAGKLLQSAATQEKAYQALALKLPGVKLEPRPNDFLYHVNRRRDLKVLPGLQVNRLSTWSKLNFPFTVSPGTPFKWPERCFSAVQLDMNTAPETAALLPAKLLPQILEELSLLALEIAERGDVE